MTDLITTTPATSQTGLTSSNRSGASSISSDFDTFLTLLTAQIQNQDPLEPMDSDAFATQLATFSGVEQQVQTNGLLETMIAQNTGDEFTRMAGWIGHEVRASAPTWVGDGPVTIDPNSPLAGTRHEIVVRNEDGAEVHRIRSNDSGDPVTWDGQHSGGAVPEGLYSFTVESFEDGALIATETAATFGRVDEVRSSAQGPLFLLQGGVEISASQVSAIRNAVS